MSQPATVIGLGAMGSVITGALLDAGHPVTVWNRTRARAEPLVARGAVLAEGVAGAVAASELVLITVNDSAAVHDVLDQAGDAIQGRTVANLVTGTPDEARAVGERLKGLGAAALDGVMMAVPSMIGTPQAQILYGGPADVYRAHEATLLSIAGDSPLLGDDLGLPALYDVGLLTLLYATMTGWLQAFAVVGAGGVDATSFLPYARAWFDNVVTGDDPAEIAGWVDRREYPDTVPSPVGLNADALHLILQVHEQLGVDPGLVRAISALADRRVEAGHAKDGFTSLVEAIRSPAG
jgi:3-hydroxyisobutyrate dehydrogenase-like beta-hydroxyacid dehydrogenase